MNTQTGELVATEFLETMSKDQRKKFIPVFRDLTARERCDRQIGLYSPCACGSGKNFKFCHYKP